MVIGTSAIVFAATAAVGVVFAFARPADARFMHQCSSKYHAAAKAGCRANAAKASALLPRGITLGIGDVVSVTIFEPPGGLFVPSDAGARPGNFVTLPNQIVDSNGNITVPYAGTIPAAGRTPSEVQQAINEALRETKRQSTKASSIRSLGRCWRISVGHPASPWCEWAMRWDCTSCFTPKDR